MSYYNWQVIFKRAYKRTYHKRNRELLRKFAEYIQKEPPVWLTPRPEELANLAQVRQNAFRYLLNNCTDHQLMALIKLEKRYSANEIEP